MGLRTRPRPALVGLLFALAACGQTVEAPAATDPPPTDGEVSATASTATTIPPETTIVNNEPEPTAPGDLQPASTQPTRVTDPPGGSVDQALSGLAEQAVADLADRLDVTASSVTVLSSERVVWPDGSLGCPRPDMEYLQVLADGFRILLQHDGTTYSYHGGGSTAEPFLCEQPGKPAVGVSPGGGDT